MEKLGVRVGRFSGKVKGFGENVVGSAAVASLVGMGVSHIYREVYGM